MFCAQVQIFNTAENIPQIYASVSKNNNVSVITGISVTNALISEAQNYKRNEVSSRLFSGIQLLKIPGNPDDGEAVVSDVAGGAAVGDVTGGTLPDT